MALYVDGTLVASSTYNTTYSYSGYVHVGASYLYTLPNASGYYLNGQIADAAYYPTTLSASSVATHWELR
jgi:hypothetical protein